MPRKKKQNEENTGHALNPEGPGKFEIEKPKSKPQKMLENIKMEFMTSAEPLRDIFARHNLNMDIIPRHVRYNWEKEREAFWSAEVPDPIRRKRFIDYILNKTKSMVQQLNDNIEFILHATYKEDEKTGSLRVEYPLTPQYIMLISNALKSNLEIARDVAAQNSESLDRSAGRVDDINKKLVDILEMLEQKAKPGYIEIPVDSIIRE